MGLFQRLKNIFTGGRPAGGGFFERARQRRVERQARRSERIMDKMEKQQRKEQERRQKEADFKKKVEAYNKGKKTFEARWGFSDREYDNFIQFVSSIPDEMKEAFGSENLVEVFRTGKDLGLSPEDLKNVVTQTYNTAGGTQEDLINDIYFMMEQMSNQMSEGAYV